MAHRPGSRGGSTTDRLPTLEFKKLQRELGLESLVLTGQNTYTAILDDIRVGDVLETAYTLRSVNPLFQGHTGSRRYLGDANPVVHERIKVRVPTSLPSLRTNFLLPDGIKDLPDSLYRLATVKEALEHTTVGDENIISWEGRDLPAIQFDMAIPTRAHPYLPMLRVSTFTTWSDVVQWAIPLFTPPSTLPPVLAELIGRWKQLPNQAKQIEAAVNWVENDIRYFALDLGQNTVKPRPIADVCSTRFGDCKDKALLLSYILRQLNIEAWPALASTLWRDRLHEIRPDPRAFNHAVVAYRHKGRLCWVDPTLSQQHGIDGEWAFPPHRTALIIRADSDDLTDCETQTGTKPDLETTDRITVEQTGDAVLRTTVILRGLQADYYRPSLSSTSAAQRSKSYFNFISTFYPGLEEIVGPVCEDAVDANQIAIRGEYRLRNHLRHEGSVPTIAVYAYALRALVDQPQSRRRHWPYALPGNRYVRHRIEVDLPFEAGPDQSPEVIRMPGLRYRLERGLAGRRLVVNHDLEVTADSVTAEQMPQFCDNIDELLRTLATVVRGPAPTNLTGPDAAGKPAAPSSPSTASTSGSP